MGAVKSRPLLIVLASVFAGLATVLTVGAAVTGTLLVLLAAVPLALTAVLMWYQGTGRFVAGPFGSPGRSRVRRTSRHTHTTIGGASTQKRDPERDDGSWEDPFWAEVEREARTRARRRARRHAADAGGGVADGWRDGRERADRLGGRTLAESYDLLGVDPGADEEAVREAYRERAKVAHPDTDGGSAEEFQELNEAYERVVEDL